MKPRSLNEAFMPVLSYALKVESALCLGEALDAQRVSEDIVEMIHIASENIAKMESERFWDSVFAVCAFIDELFLDSKNGEFSLSWQKYMLQKGFFRTTNAGVLFFKKLEENRDDVALKELYEYVLALGFKGRYFSQEDMDRLEELKVENTKETSLTYVHPLFDDAYAKSSPKLVGEKGSFLARASVFILPPIIFFALYYMLDSMIFLKLNEIAANSALL